MGFFENYTDTGKWNFVSKEEREVLIKNRVAFVPERILEVESKQKDFSDQYVIFTRLPGDEDEVRAIGFGKGSVESRDRLLSALAGYLDQLEAGEETDPAPSLYIERIGQAQILKNADAPVEADANA